MSDRFGTANVSPFVTHRDKVLGWYGTAGYLRQVVLGLWSGGAYPVNLSRLGGLDDAHFAAVIAMLEHYRVHGESDAAFVALAEACLERGEQERAAAERSNALDTWCSQAQREVVAKGGRRGLVDDHANWFEARFEEGMASEAAAGAAIQRDLDAERARRRAED